jgi:hypothetical protein
MAQLGHHKQSIVEEILQRDKEYKALAGTTLEQVIDTVDIDLVNPRRTQVRR